MQRHRIRHYVRHALSYPPHVTLRKARLKIGGRLRRDGTRLRSQLLGSTISDRTFMRALEPQFRPPGAFLAHMASRTRPKFLLDSAERPALIAALRALDPAAAPRTIAAADHACEHIFDLLGSGPTALGAVIDWHCDFKTGHRWSPRQYYSEIRAAPYPGGYDLKVPWELSRCQHFTWLGQAYWLTDDDRYAAEFVAQVTDWIDRNPPRFGVNWACAMDIAIRAVNWLWGYYFFRDSSALTPEFQLLFFKSLLAHGRHIMDNLEWSDTLTSNHYLSDIVGLVYLGLLLPELTEARQWREFGLRELERELFKQVYADGVDFEASTSYHRLVAELFISATRLAQLNGHHFGAAYLERLEQMFVFTMYLTKPDGTVPMIGDNDNGRLHRLKVWADPSREWLDHRYLLAIGAVVFERPDFALSAGDQWEEAMWLCGTPAIHMREQTLRERPTPIQLGSRAFPEGGLYIMRDVDYYVIVDAGRNGQNGNGGHAHNDILSFELYGLGRSWIVDPGLFVYTADYMARQRFRATASHNTVMIAATEQNECSADAPWSLATDANVTIVRWSSGAQDDILVAEHTGYARLKPPVVHRRHFQFDKQHRRLTIRDELLAAEAPELRAALHFAPALSASRDSSTIMVEEPGAAASGALRIQWPNVRPDDLALGAGEVALGYGQLQAASEVTLTGRYSAIDLILDFILPAAPSGETS